MLLGKPGREETQIVIISIKHVLLSYPHEIIKDLRKVESNLHHDVLVYYLFSFNYITFLQCLLS